MPFLRIPQPHGFLLLFRVRDHAKIICINFDHSSHSKKVYSAFLKESPSLPNMKVYSEDDLWEFNLCNKLTDYNLTRQQLDFAEIYLPGSLSEKYWIILFNALNPDSDFYILGIGTLEPGELTLLWSWFPWKIVNSHCSDFPFRGKAVTSVNRPWPVFMDIWERNWDKLFLWLLIKCLLLFLKQKSPKKSVCNSFLFLKSWTNR